MDDLGFLIKVLVFSGGLAIAIKRIAPHWPLPETAALSLVLLPALLMGSWLVWQQRRG